jgi:hypothetical protein
MSILSKVIPHKKDSSLEMSSPSCKTVYGVKIQKLPIARYIQVLQAADNLPELLLGTAFPQAEDLSQLIKEVSALDKAAVLKLIGRLLTVVPTETCKLLSGLLYIPQERLLNPDCDDALSLNELMEIVLAFIEANDYSSFFTLVQSLVQICRPMTVPTQGGIGCSAG